MMLHPEIPTCQDCSQFFYDAEWRPQMHRGERVKQKGIPRTPCWRCPKGKPDLKPHPEKELSAKNWQALMLYYQVKAGAPMPDDSVVQRNCGLIELVVAQVERSQYDLTPLYALMAGGKK